MNEHQKRIWKQMIGMIRNYLNGRDNDFFSLVGSLEGALDAGEYKDLVLIKKWYSYWGPLEELRSVVGRDVQIEDTIGLLNDFLNFLENELKTS